MEKIKNKKYQLTTAVHDAHIYDAVEVGLPEVRVSVKRDLQHSQKRPNTKAKETYLTLAYLSCSSETKGRRFSMELIHIR